MIHCFRIQDSGFRKRAANHSLFASLMIPGYRGSEKMQNSMGTPPSTFKHSRVSMSQLPRKSRTLHRYIHTQVSLLTWVAVPPLEMIDDIITAVECGPKSVKLNAMVNAFIESKKLALSVEKCAKVHLGNKSSTNTCPEHKVHSESMKNSDKEKYLGDFISKSANSKETIKSRNIRGNAVLSELRAILRDIPLGKRRTQVGLILRQAWFLNGCLFNSEV